MLLNTTEKARLFVQRYNRGVAKEYLNWLRFYSSPRLETFQGLDGWVTTAKFVNDVPCHDQLELDRLADDGG